MESLETIQYLITVQRRHVVTGETLWPRLNWQTRQSVYESKNTMLFFGEAVSLFVTSQSFHRQMSQIERGSSSYKYYRTGWTIHSFSRPSNNQWQINTASFWLMYINLPFWIRLGAKTIKWTWIDLVPQTARQLKMLWERNRGRHSLHLSCCWTHSNPSCLLDFMNINQSKFSLIIFGIWTQP